MSAILFALLALIALLVVFGKLIALALAGLAGAL